MLATDCALGLAPAEAHGAFCEESSIPRRLLYIHQTTTGYAVTGLQRIMALGAKGDEALTAISPAFG